MAKRRAGYPSDVSDEEWAFCAPYLTLIKESSPQRTHSLREIFNGLRWFIRAGCPWRMIPNDLPPWWAVYQQAQRWIKAGCFEAMAHDLRTLLKKAPKILNVTVWSPFFSMNASKSLSMSAFSK